MAGVIWLTWLGAQAAETATSTPPLPADHAQRMSRGLERFQSHIKPLLITHCVKCHGGEKTKGELDLTTREGLLKGGAEGPAIQPFAAAASRLMRLVSHEQEPHMPSKADRLSAADQASLAAWIDEGAPYTSALIEGRTAPKKDRSQITGSDREWWAFQPLRPVTPPKPSGVRAFSNPIDAFLQARLQDKKLKLNPTADRRTLIRRASFDLLGLPPTPEQVEEFTRDRSAEAWPKLIARLLESPRHGERWARHWLDVARFAESSGFEHDYDRPSAYHYRDFVIKALNSDLPFDQFVRWQIAGDEFEPDNPLALMATGFLGAGVFPTQITANEVERTRYDALDDMLSTTGTAMLGLTVGCARCHDHKFDPIPTSDYYRMLSTFTTTVRSELELDLQPEENRRARAQFEEQHAPLAQELQRYETEKLPHRFEAWLTSGAPLPAPATWNILRASELTSKAGAKFKDLGDGSYLAEGANGDADTYTFTATTSAKGLRALRLEALSHASMTKGGPGRADNGNIGLSRIRLFVSQAGSPPTNELKLVRPRATFEQNSSSLAIASALDDNPKTGWAVDPKFGTNHAAIFELEKPLEAEGGIQLRVTLEFGLNSRHNIGRPRLAVTTSANPALDGQALPAEIANLLDQVRAKPSDAAALTSINRTLLRNWWRHLDPQWQALQEKVETHARQAPKPKLTKVLICGEGYPAVRMHTQGADFFPETHFLQRGSTDLKRGVATQDFLQVLKRHDEPATRWRWEPPSTAKFSGRRRALANWLTDVESGAGHLLARVMVNRLWQHHFGQGLVSTANDFGVQGTKPSHPELLDWLALRLIQERWHLKPIHELMMTSLAYQQTSEVDDAKQQADPANQLISRRVPQRLQAEAIRDSLLFVSGALDTNMFGPGTLDENSRRRSIYFTVKRSQLIPSMTAFDAPEPLVSQGSRPTTTVAPQALWLMNSAPVRSWAEAFTKRFATSADEPVTKQVSRAYLLALNRRPTAQEATQSFEFIEAQTKRYQAQKQANPRQLALTDFAQVVLDLNEFLYVD